MNNKLLLFDIDGTLLLSAGAGRAAMNRAFEQVYKIRNGFETIPMMGRTDEGLLRDVLKNYNLPEDPIKTDTFKTVYYKCLEKELLIPRPDKILCPGIMELLTELESVDGICLGLLTGNWETSAYQKLTHFGLDKFFNFGAFGGDAPTRSGLVPAAIIKYRNKFGQSITPDRIIVIGDTPRDIQAAKPHGVRTVGVATGFHSVNEIAAENPDIVFEDFTKTEKIVNYFVHKI